MPGPLSLDLRERIVDALEAAEESHPLIAERFGVSVTSVERMSRRVREGKPLEADKPPGPGKKLGDVHLDWIQGELERDPFITSYDLRTRFCRRFPRLPVHRSTILRAMHELGFTFKKNSVCPPT